MRTGVLVAALALTACFQLVGATAAEAQFSISRFTVDGGGGSSAGGAFVLSGTAGQPDAGTHSGGAFVLSGGFWSGGGAVSGIGADTDPELPGAPAPVLVFQVFPVSPNPVIDHMALTFELPEPRWVRSQVFDTNGRLVRVLVDGLVAAGRHEQAWDRRDQSGIRVPAGIYFVRFDAGDKGNRQKVVVLS
ncbi:MAG: FlgD immunoglobulin-like domain containing protein [Candidatus Eisenbacteria bacterium]|uniref:T9SS type A sorting domain-containing protein n=1 Tax=Eiseniibacteriota bacterium TaxID=2212470 RepID=A0A956LWH9_UNCEI|nr:T9SS type A sorting domain-containing protein [Candidatus Eisenbacteria bacterium]